ncbi:MAG: response regulator transcription factor [Acidobacteria bacterium]|nr:response regulator transcription factor [Acidobacteriota bacterium]
MPDTCSVYVCDQQPIIIEGVRHVLECAAEFSFAGGCLLLAGARDPIRESRPDIVLLDHSYGIQAIGPFIEELKGGGRPHFVLWVVDYDQGECLRALHAGARAVLKKTAPISTLIACLRTVAAGTVWLEESALPAVRAQYRRLSQPRISQREHDIIACVRRGLLNREIAAELGITPGTVKVHLMHIFEKTGVKDRHELALWARVNERYKTAGA